MTVIRTSTGTVQEVATEDGPMLTAAGSLQYGTAPIVYAGSEPIPGADTSFALVGSGMQEVYAGGADLIWVLETGSWNDAGYWLVGRVW